MALKERIIDAIDKGATLSDLAVVLRITEEEVRNIIGSSPEKKAVKANIPYGKEFDEQPVSNQLAEVTVDAQRRSPTLLQQVTVDAQRRSSDLLRPVTVEAQRRTSPLPMARYVNEAYADITQVDPLQEVTVDGQRRASSLPMNTYVEDLFADVTRYDNVPPAVIESIQRRKQYLSDPFEGVPEAVLKTLRNRRAMQQEKVATAEQETLDLFSLGFADEINAAVSAASDGNVEYLSELSRLQEQRRERQQLYPQAAIAGQVAGVAVQLPVSVAGWAAASRAAPALRGAGTQAGIESGLFGVGTGETAEERIGQGVAFGTLGYGLGFGLEALTRGASTAIARSRTKVDVDAVNNPPARTAEEIQQNIDAELGELSIQIEARNTMPNAKPRQLRDEQGATFHEYNGVKILGNSKQGYEVPGIGTFRTLKEAAEAVDEQFARRLSLLDEEAAELALLRNIEETGQFSELGRLNKEGEGVKFTVARESDKDPTLFSQFFDMAEETARRFVSPQLAGALKRGAENKLRQMNEFFDAYVVPTQSVISVWGHNMKASKAILDFARGLDKREVFVARLRNAGLTNDEIAAVNNYINARSDLFKSQRFIITDEAVSNGERLHIQVVPDKPTYATRGGGRDYLKQQVDNSQKALKNKERATDEMIAQYENPFLTDFNLLNQNMMLSEIAKLMDVGSLGSKTAGLDDAILALKNRMAQDIPETVAARGARIIQDVVAGDQRAAPAWAQLLSTLSYGGTLMSFKAAIMNLHDQFVAPLLWGVSATLRGSNKAFSREGHSYVDPLTTGLSRQTQGEYAQKLMDEMSRMAGDPTLIQRVNTAAAKGLEKGMKWTLFSGMDTVGKRSIMNAVIENGFDLARTGKFVEQWGRYFNQKEMYTMINAFRKHGTDFEKMSEKEVNLMAQLAYAGLGRQQLISIAGRPLAWANNPRLRPLYTLMGFAIVQRSLLRNLVYENLVAGDIATAAKYSAAYVASAGVGYAVLDEARDFVFSGGEDKVTGEELLFKALVDQPLSVLSLNKAPVSSYEWNRFKANPYEFALLSLAPAGGLIEQGGQAGIDLITGDVDKAFEHIMRVPALKNSIGLAIEVVGEPEVDTD